MPAINHDRHVDFREYLARIARIGLDKYRLGIFSGALAGDIIPDATGSIPDQISLIIPGQAS